jgi:hypothetical protein
MYRIYPFGMVWVMGKPVVGYHYRQGLVALPEVGRDIGMVILVTAAKVGGG